MRVRGKQPERPVEDKSRKSPPPLALQLGDPRARGPAGARVLQRPSVAAPRSPPLPARPQTALPAARETRHAQSFPARRLEKVEARPGSRASKHGRGWSGAQAGGDGKGSESSEPLPRIPRCPQAGPGPSNPKGEGLLPPTQPSSGGREGVGPRQELGYTPGVATRAWSSWVCFFLFS